MPDYPFLKGHGTENDFVLLPDHDGSVHGDLSADRVRALCDRRAGIGGDGVLRVIRTSAIEAGRGQDAEWFMDYRNSDGSVSEMCGNGIRVFALHLVEEGLADAGAPIPIGTRDGVKVLTIDGDRITADMGTPKRARRDHGVRGRAHLAGRGTSTWATRTRSRSSTTSPTQATCSTRPAHDARALPRRRQRGVRRTPWGAARRDARARARLGRDPLVRHRRLRGDGGRCRRPTAPTATSPTGSTCPAAPSPSPGPPTTGSC